MRFKPHNYQQKAIEWIKDHPRCGLFLDMGLGKTVSTLTAIRDLIDEAELRRVLVVAPKKVAESTWSTEAQKWDHLRGLRVSKVIGTAKQRAEALEAEADVYVTGRDNLVSLLDHYGGRCPFDCLVLDELTSFKSNTAQRFKALKKWSPQARRVIGLTGTPAPNGLLDLWAQLYCLDLGERLGKFITRYREAYFNAVRVGSFAFKYTLKRGAEEAILAKLADICLTMQAADYLELPPLIELTERVELPEPVMKGYRAFERDMVAIIDEEDVTADNAAALLNKLSQYAGGAVYDDDKTAHEVHREKLERLSELVEAAGCPVLVFYQFKHEAARIAEKLKAEQYDGPETLARWNAGQIPVLLAHPASTAYGLNMQGGGHVIVWYSTGWNLEQYQQANARLHRQGQEHPVTVYRLVSAGTVDELSAAAIDRKSGEQQNAITILKNLKKMIV